MTESLLFLFVNLSVWASIEQSDGSLLLVTKRSVMGAGRLLAAWGCGLHPTAPENQGAGRLPWRWRQSAEPSRPDSGPLGASGAPTNMVCPLGGKKREGLVLPQTERVPRALDFQSQNQESPGQTRTIWSPQKQLRYKEKKNLELSMNLVSSLIKG